MLRDMLDLPQDLQPRQQREIRHVLTLAARAFHDLQKREHSEIQRIENSRSDVD
jgi:hypothetical protein